MKTANQRLGLLLMSALFLSACSINTPDDLSLDTSVDNVHDGLLNCSVNVQDSVMADEDVSVVLSMSGGVGPYHLIGTVGSFATSTTTTRSYTNDSNSIITASDTAQVIDTLGLSTQCEWDVEVSPSGSSTTPSLSYAVSPSSAVEIGNPITITTSTMDFTNTPTVSFSYAESGVAMSQSGSMATFTVVDGQAHNFDVTITASNPTDGETVIKTVNLSFFMSTSGLTCYLTRSTGSYYPNQSIEFEVHATNGDTLRFSSFSPGTNGSAVLDGDDTVDVIYTSTGTKNILAQAVSLTTGETCNNGVFMSDVVLVEEDPTQQPLACNAVTQYRNYFAYETVWANAQVEDNSGTGSVTITSVSSSPTAGGYYWLYPSSPLWASMYFPTPGLYNITLTIEDSSGTESSCTAPSVRIW